MPGGRLPAAARGKGRLSSGVGCAASSRPLYAIDGSFYVQQRTDPQLCHFVDALGRRSSAGGDAKQCRLRTSSSESLEEMFVRTWNGWPVFTGNLRRSLHHQAGSQPARVLACSLSSQCRICSAHRLVVFGVLNSGFVAVAEAAVAEGPPLALYKPVLPLRAIRPPIGQAYSGKGKKNTHEKKNKKREQGLRLHVRRHCLLAA